MQHQLTIEQTHAPEDTATSRRRGLSPLGRRLTSRVEDQRGITTAEYAVGTAAGAGLAGILFKMFTGGFGESMLRTFFQHVMGLLGIG